MHVIIINGSPRVQKLSNTAKIIQSFGKGLQADAVGPVDGTVALGLDDGLLGRPGDDMGDKVIRINELLFASIEKLGTHPQHLPAIGQLGIQANDLPVIEGKSDQPRRVGDADVDVAIHDKGSTLIRVAQCHRPPEGQAQQ